MSSIRHWRDFRVVIIFESGLMGFLIGTGIAGYRSLLTGCDLLRRGLYETLRGSPPERTVVPVLSFAALSVLIAWACRTRPRIKGGGIPQIKDPQFQTPSRDWLIDMPLKFFTTVLSLGMGLSLGKCGPAVQISSYIGKGFGTLFPRPPEAERARVKSAGAAGFAAVFNAPLSGILFAVEELGMPLSPLFLVRSLSAAAAAHLTAAAWLGTGALFDFSAIEALSLSLIPWVMVLGVLAALVADIFKRSLYLALSWYERLPHLARPLIPAATAVLLGFLCFDLTGGGYDLIASLPGGERPLEALGFLLAGKILFTALCAGSGAPGGLFFPILCCGALVGKGFGAALVMAGFAAEPATLNFMILGIAAFFTAALKAPLTGILLILEMSGAVNHLGTLVPACLTSLIASDLIMSRSVNEVLLARLLKSRSVPEQAEEKED